jgi:hypothetical protein
MTVRRPGASIACRCCAIAKLSGSGEMLQGVAAKIVGSGR